MTLIELLVTIAVMTVGFVALLSGFAVIERQVGSTSDDAQLTTVARQVADVIKAEPTLANGFGQGGLPYAVCASTSSYSTPLNAPGRIAKGSDTVTVTSVTQSTGGTHTVSGVAGPLLALASCTGGGSDYGVQQITFKVTSPQGNSISRTVYKRWN